MAKRSHKKGPRRIAPQPDALPGDVDGNSVNNEGRAGDVGKGGGGDEQDEGKRKRQEAFYSVFGPHSRANRCASAIWSGVIFERRCRGYWPLFRAQ